MKTNKEKIQAFTLYSFITLLAGGVISLNLFVGGQFFSFFSEDNKDVILSLDPNPGMNDEYSKNSYSDEQFDIYGHRLLADMTPDEIIKATYSPRFILELAKDGFLAILLTILTVDIALPVLIMEHGK
jgi:hypothetical protein